MASIVVKLGGRKKGLAALMEATVPPLLKPASRDWFAEAAIWKRLPSTPGVIFPPLTRKLFTMGVLLAIRSATWPGKVSPNSPKPPRTTVLPLFVGVQAKPTRGCQITNVVSEKA